MSASQDQIEEIVHRMTGDAGERESLMEQLAAVGEFIDECQALLDGVLTEGDRHPVFPEAGERSHSDRERRSSPAILPKEFDRVGQVVSGEADLPRADITDDLGSSFAGVGREAETPGQGYDRLLGDAPVLPAGPFLQSAVDILGKVPYLQGRHYRFLSSVLIRAPRKPGSPMNRISEPVFGIRTGRNNGTGERPGTPLHYGDCIMHAICMSCHGGGSRNWSGRFWITFRSQASGYPRSRLRM